LPALGPLSTHVQKEFVMKWFRLLSSRRLCAAACAFGLAVVLIGSPPVIAAERVVLGEEFTATW
jgi:hypothetical protein